MQDTSFSTNTAKQSFAREGSVSVPDCIGCPLGAVGGGSREEVTAALFLVHKIDVTVVQKPDDDRGFLHQHPRCCRVREGKRKRPKK